MNNNELLLKEIDDNHKAANDALRSKMFENYIDFFGNDLKYKQSNGKIIGKTALSHDIKSYFNRVLDYTSRYERLSFTIEKEIITEELINMPKFH